MKKVLVLLLVLGLAGSASAATGYFLPTGGTGDFNTAANWNTGAVPDYFTNGDSAYFSGDSTCYVNSTHYIAAGKVGIGPWEYADPNNGEMGATLVINEGGYLAAVNGWLMGYASDYGTGDSAKVIVNGGTIGDRQLIGTASGWSGWGWGKPFEFCMNGGYGAFFVNGGNAGRTSLSNHAFLYLTYLVKNNGTDEQFFAVRSGSELWATFAEGGPQRFYIGKGGTLVVRTTALAYVQANMQTEGGETPTYTEDGVWTRIYVPEPATIALLGIGSLLMIRRKK